MIFPKFIYLLVFFLVHVVATELLLVELSDLAFRFYRDKKSGNILDYFCG